MAAKALPETLKELYRVPKPDIFSRGIPAKLPQAYKDFFKAWTAEPTIPVHYHPEPGKWKRHPVTGVVTPVQNLPIHPKYPKESNEGIWGGEGPVLGYVKPKKHYRQKTTKWWMPHLERSAVYSEILDQRLSMIVTKRTINLIIDHQGFDQYILETAPCDLKSLLALKLRKKMLIALFDKTLYPNDPETREKIYDKYKHHLENYNREDLEWYALSIGEAVTKFMEDEDRFEPQPLKHRFRQELIEELKVLAANNELEEATAEAHPRESSSWLTKINPFSKKA